MSLVNVPDIAPKTAHKSHILHEKCSHCGKIAEVVTSKPGLKYIQQTLKCGHVRMVEKVEAKAGIFDDIVFEDGARPYPYQIEVAEKTVKANFRALFRLEQRLGKTICVLTLLKAYPDLKPCIIVCKAAITMQWFMEVMDRLDDIAQVVRSGKEIPKLDIVIISVDTLTRATWLDDEKVMARYKTIIIDECQSIKNHDAARTNAVRKLCNRSHVIRRVYSPNLDARRKMQIIAEDLMRYHGVSESFKLNFESLGPKKLGITECRVTSDGRIYGTITIDKRHAENDDESEVIETIIHEIAHAITPGAGHVKLWSETCLAIGGDGEQYASWCSGTVNPVDEFTKPINIIALSGTPIKNHAGEYFPILNILHPEIFPYREPFIRDWVDSYSDGYGSKMGGIKPWRLDAFTEITKPFIFNYTREQVAPDLPTINRQTLFVDIENKEVRKAYGKALDEFLDAEDENDNSTSIIGKLAKLRHIVGFAKINPIKDHIDEFMESYECKRNLLVFVHHQDVGLLLSKKLTDEGYDVLSFTSAMNADQRFKVIQEFNGSTGTILVASTGAASEGVTVKNCNDIVFCERQWNPASEEQAEARPINYETKDSKINVVYPTVIGSIDEMLANLVGRKRVNINQVLTGDGSIPWDSDSIVKELAAELRRKGRNAWKV